MKKRTFEGPHNAEYTYHSIPVVTSHDDILKKRIEEEPHSAKYTYHSFQDTLLRIMADVNLSEIKKEISHSEYYSIIADATKDVKKEQISVVLRYLHDDKIHEEFIVFSYVEFVDVESLYYS